MGKVEVKFVLLSQTCSNYKSWYGDMVKEFEGIRSSAALVNQITQLKNGKDTVDGRMAYRAAKSELQEQWLDFYEDRLVQLSQDALRDAKRPSVDLYVVAMPEFQIHDYEAPALRKDRGTGYSNPLYEETVRSFVGLPSSTQGTIRARRCEGRQARTFIDFTSQNQNVLVFAGSTWWKRWEDKRYPKGMIFNSAVVFYQGACRFMWDKQNISNLDGLVEENVYQQWLMGRYDMMLDEDFPLHEKIKADPLKPEERGEWIGEVIITTEEYLQKYHRGILSDLTKQFNPLCTAVTGIEIPGKGVLQFSLDLCVDAKYCPGIEGMPMSRLFQDFEIIIREDADPMGPYKIKGEKAHIQMVLAADIVRPGQYAKQLFCCCDSKHSCRVCEIGNSDTHLEDVMNGLFVVSDGMELDI